MRYLYSFLLVFGAIIQLGAACVTKSCVVVKRANVINRNDIVQTQDFIIQQKIVDYGQFVNPVLVPASSLGLQYYYKVNADTQIDEEALAEKVATKVVTKLSDLFNNQPQPLPIPPKPEPNAPSIPIPEPIPTPQPIPLLPPVGPVEVDGYPTASSSQVWGIVEAKCVTCHTGGGTGAAHLDLGKVSFDKLTKLQRWDIFDRTDGSHLEKSKIMPKNGPPLNDADIKIIRQWAREL